MAEDYKLQLSTTVNGNLLNVRADSAEELKATLEGLASNIDDVVSAFGQVKQAVIAKDIFTGNASTPTGGGGYTPKGGAAKTNASGVPECKHGPMKDLRSKNYKSDFYCASDDRDNQCKPVKL